MDDSILHHNFHCHSSKIMMTWHRLLHLENTLCRPEHLFSTKQMH